MTEYAVVDRESTRKGNKARLKIRKTEKNNAAENEFHM